MGTPTLRLRTKFLLMLVGLMALLGFSLIAFVQTTVRERLTLELEKRGVALAEYTASLNTSAILTGDFRTLRINLLDEKQEHEKELEYIFVLDRNRKVVAHTFGDRFPTDLIDANSVSPGANFSSRILVAEKKTVFDIAIPILHNSLGEVHVGLNEEVVGKGVADITGLFIRTILLALTAGFIGIFLFSLRITRAISLLAQAADKIGRGDLSSRVIIKTGDELESLASAFNEMTDRLKKEAETLQESNRRYKDILDDTQDLIQSVRPDGTFEFVNTTWHRTMGYSEEEVKTLKVFDIIHPDMLSHCQTLFMRVMNGESVKDVESAYRTKSGQKILLRGNIVPRFIDNKVIGTHVFFKDITEQERSKEFTKNVLEVVDEAFIVIDPEYRITHANRAYGKLTKKPIAELIGSHCYTASHSLDKPCFELGEDCPVKLAFQTGEPHTALHTHRSKNGPLLYVEIKAFPLKADTGKVVSAIELINDVTERKALEHQFRQAQKMEAIGTLAGGVAHDFNNLLTVISGYGNIILKKLSKDDPQRQNVQHVLDAADRAAHLTKDLLVFSRKQIADKKPVDLNDIIRTVEKFIVRVIGEDISCATTFREGTLVVSADAFQLEQVLMNFATNARDAMPQGGLFTITTEQVGLDEKFIAVHGYGKPGLYAMASISDTGQGMDEATSLRIFEPFFTTKEVGKGTGLGLAVVYGIIKQHGGYINVYSEPGKGTTFRIYLPLIASGAEEESAPPEAKNPGNGTETVLVAEDNEQVRALTVSVLQEAGYTVIAAVDGEDAIKKYQENKDRIQLLLFDIIMPRKSGKEAYDEIRKITPNVNVLFESGYAPDLIRQKALLNEHLPVVYKPISSADLLQAVRQTLDKGKPDVKGNGRR